MRKTLIRQFLFICTLLLIFVDSRRIFPDVTIEGEKVNKWGDDKTEIIVENLNFIPSAYYHIFGRSDNELRLIKINVRNLTKTGQNIRISSSVVKLTLTAEDEFFLPGEKSAAVFQSPHFSKNTWKSLPKEQIPDANLKIEIIRKEDNQKWEINRTITIFPRDMFIQKIKSLVLDHELDLTDYMSVWVTPNDPKIDEICAKAAKYTSDGNLQGYQPKISGTAERMINTREIVKAIFTALKKDYQFCYVDSASAGITYPLAPDEAQRIKLPADSFATSTSNCIDSVVMYASILKHNGIEPMIIVMPGHAILGWRAWAGFERYEALETTVIKNHTFEEAFKKGMEIVDENYRTGKFDIAKVASGKFAGSTLKIIRVNEMHDKGISPIYEVGATLMRLAILPFKNKTGDAKYDIFAMGMSEEIQTEMNKFRKYLFLKDVDGIKYIIEEQKIADFDNISKLGEVLKVDVIIKGNFIIIGNSVKVAVSAIDARTGEIQLKQSYPLKKKEDILEVPEMFVKDFVREYKIQGEVHTKQTNSLQAFEFYSKARNAYLSFSENGIKESIFLFKKAIENDPEYALAYAGLTEAYFLQVWLLRLHNQPYEDIEKLEYQAAEKAVKLKPGLYQTHRAMALAYFNRGKRLKAVDEIHSALKLNPDDGESYFILSMLMQEKDEKEEIRLLEKAVDLNPSLVVAHYNLSVCYDRYDLIDRAKEQQQRIMKINPKISAVHANIANIYLYENKPEQALEHIRIAVEQDPDLPNNYGLYAYYHAMKGDSKQAIENFRKMFLKDQNFRTLLEERAYGDKELFEIKAKKIEKWMSLAKDFPDNYIDLGNMYYLKQDYPKAIQAYKKAVSLGADIPQVHFNLSFVYSFSFMNEEALAEANKAVQMSSNWPEVYICLGQAFLNNSEYDKAIEAYQKILDMNPKSNFLVWIYYGMGLAYSMKENYEKALDAFNKYLNLYYEDPNIHMEIKEIYFKQGQMEKAKQSLSNIISFADDVNIYLRLAYSYYYDFNDYFMVENMCKYADSYAKSAWDYITTGDWFRTLNKKQNAEDEYRKALVVAVTFQDYIDIARGFVNTGTSDEVLGALDKAVPLAKTFSDHYSLGRIFNEISDNEKAAGEFDTAASVAETFMDHQKIGDEFFMLKDKKAKAAVSYDRAMAKAKSPEELHDIGYRYLRAGRINKAIAAFQNSLKIKEILNTYLYLGKAYIKKGMIKEANKCYESAGNLAEANENDLLRIRAAKERVKNLSMFRKADGVVIVSFTENSKAEIAGFKPGDIIVSFDNTDISFAYELRLAGKICSTKSSVPVQIVRDGKKISMTSDCGSLGFNAWDF